MKTDILTFKKMMFFLGDEFDKSLTDQKIQLWFSQLEKYSHENLKRTFSDIVKNLKYFPRLAEVLEIAEKYRRIEKPFRIMCSKEESLQRGISLVQDILIDKLDAIQASMPDYRQRIRECENVAEKLIICFAALNSQTNFSEASVKFWTRFLSAMLEKEWK